ncbi:MULTISPECIES: SusC/RagA family TonB-linked outer membrane protein [Bacteroides]|uniref:SusC/RagA family TonB-linked outer membrane protein n=1 Tax=Bacteroides TaxID=816 RepID=UPI000E431665|nr:MULTISPECIES: TonB-dependent receptor [Bacteroides]MBS7572657.1 TonB-dependent receptor [Bacteroides propionicigenes]RGM26056.1 TonB-dependent receptor [Bacteroides sp. OM08-17BH]RHJ54886.1 TonB-dependent receptor [Bacteroides sp. AM10-21B]HBO05496.1 SusC/RagA family protein [Bacteroides sp.]
MKCTTYYFRSLGLLLLLCLIPLWSVAQNITVKGIVKDNFGEPVIGANVTEKGTTNGMITDLDGNFSLTVQKNATLVISYIGYITQEIAVKGNANLNITLKEDSKALEEVVVIGYGTARKSDVTGSIASVGGDKLREMPATNITYALQNRIAGVDMAQTSSQPGATMQIRIRGTRSLTASNDPLVVLDGIPFMGNLSDINPGDIKSMDILKDASSTAIYGSRGANGVILITTNKGAQGTPAKFTYNGYVGAKSVFSKYPMMDGKKFAEMRKYAGKFDNSLDESDDVNTDWQDLMYRTGMVTSHDVSVAGGTNQGSYSFGAAYYKDQGVIPTQNYTRYSLRGSFDQGVGKYFRFGLTTNSNYNVTKGSNIGLYNVLANSPIANPYNEDGSLKRTVKINSQDEYFVVTRDIVESLEDTWLNEQKGFGTYNNLFAEIQCPWVKGLKYRVNLGLNYRSTKGGTFTGEGVNSTTEDTPSTASLTHSETTNWAIENLITYDRTFGKHQLNIVGMYSAEETVYTKSNIAARDIPAEYLQYYNLGRAEGTITVNPDNWDYQKSGLMSWMGRAMYTYDNRYMLMATVRADASSRLAKGHQWHTYPAVSAGWNIGQESFMDDIEWLDILKVRVGYGQTSNQAVSPYSTWGKLSTRPYNFGPTGYATGYYVSALPNYNLGWEYSSTWNFGLDFTLFGGRLSGTLEYYIQKTSDLLQNVNLPATSGVSSYVGNVGKTQNKGVELTLNGTILDNYNGWTWDASLNLSANRNELTELASGAERDEANNWFVGHPVDVIYDYEKIGLWQEGDPYLAILEPGGNVGMIKVKYTGEYNEDGTPARKIGPDDRQIISMEPKFTGGFSTRVAYKGFDLNVITAFKCGGKLISTLHHANGYLNMLTGRRGQVDVDYWTEENTNAKYPKPGGIQSGDNPKYGSTLGYFDASYWKVRNISLGYNFDQQKWLKNFGIQSLRAYVSIQNPFVICSPFHKETGLDPETNSYGNENVAVTSGIQSRFLTVGTNSPSTRNYLFGINLTF